MAIFEAMARYVTAVEACRFALHHDWSRDSRTPAYLSATELATPGERQATELVEAWLALDVLDVLGAFVSITPDMARRLLNARAALLALPESRARKAAVEATTCEAAYHLALAALGPAPHPRRLESETDVADVTDASEVVAAHADDEGSLS